MLNKKKVLAIALAAMTALSVMGCNTSGLSAEVIDCIELGAEYLGDGEYEAAIEAYEEALELNEYAWEAHTGLISAMAKAERPQEEIEAQVTVAMTASLAKAEEGIEDNETEALVELYETAIDVSGENDVLVMDILITSNDVLVEENPLDEEYVAKLEEMANYYISGNNYEAAQELIDRLAEEGKDTLVEELQKALDDKKLAEEAYVQALIEASEYIIANDWAGLANFCESEQMAVLDEKLGDVGYISYAFNDAEHGGNVIAYYSMEGCSCNQWYYGQMKDGVRTGHGGWYWAKNETEGLYVETYVGQWADDVPNGSGHQYWGYRGETYIDMDVTVVNGLVDGTYTASSIDEDGYEWTAEYTVENGKYVEIEVEDWIGQEEGRIIYAVAYREYEDGTRSAIKWTAAENDVEGIAHFR